MIEKEDEYISYTATLTTDNGTTYESWVYRTRIVRTGKYKVGGHITASNPKMRLYDVRDHTTIENIFSKKLADTNTETVKRDFKDKIMKYTEEEESTMTENEITRSTIVRIELANLIQEIVEKPDRWYSEESEPTEKLIEYLKQYGITIPKLPEDIERRREVVRLMVRAWNTIEALNSVNILMEE